MIKKTYIDRVSLKFKEIKKVISLRQKQENNKNSRGTILSSTLDALIEGM